MTTKRPVTSRRVIKDLGPTLGGDFVPSALNDARGRARGMMPPDIARRLPDGSQAILTALVEAVGYEFQETVTAEREVAAQVSKARLDERKQPNPVSTLLRKCAALEKELPEMKEHLSSLRDFLHRSGDVLKATTNGEDRALADIEGALDQRGKELEAHRGPDIPKSYGLLGATRQADEGLPFPDVFYEQGYAAVKDLMRLGVRKTPAARAVIYCIQPLFGSLGTREAGERAYKTLLGWIDKNREQPPAKIGTEAA